MEKMKALIIDDEEIVLDSVRRILEEDDFKVDTCLSGLEGMRQAIQKTYDIVLTDLRMPDVGGMRVLRDIKRAKPGLPVVMITGFGSIKTAVQAIKLGAAEYIQKPFSPEELSAAVKTALQIAAMRPPEEQGIIHKTEVLRVLQRASSDPLLVSNMLCYGADALDEFNLTGPEKLAILTGDIHWIEQYVGPLSSVQRKWLEQRLSAEIW
ncbi:MAG: response regulator [Desulfobacteraceae bacterium]|nr:MAG: response regulator [Desulfobacteraceae bacterium]